jgi:Sec-independent protein secretion pathway component TatC
MNQCYHFIAWARGVSSSANHFTAQQHFLCLCQGCILSFGLGFQLPINFRALTLADQVRSLKGSVFIQQDTEANVGAPAATEF